VRDRGEGRRSLRRDAGSGIVRQASIMADGTSHCPSSAFESK
jgi:hypothetical protein